MKTRFKSSARVRRITAKVTDADANAVELFELPTGSLVLGVSLAVTDAFNGSATLKVGTSDNDDVLLTAAPIDALGTFNPDLANALYTTKPTMFTATVSDKTSAGAVYVTLVFSFDRDTVL